MRKIFLYLFLSASLILTAQNKSTKHRSDNLNIPGYSVLDLFGSYDYNYYENANGEYIKHGNFKMSATGSGTYRENLKKRTIKETYTASGKFVDGWLHGTLTVKRRIQDSPDFHEWTLTANFKNGLAHGEWKVSYKNNTTSAPHAICHFDEGQMVGAVDFNWYKANNGDFTNSWTKVLKGTLDNEGRYHGKWNIISSDGSDKDYYFEHGACYRKVFREKDGSGGSDRNQDAVQKSKEVALRYANEGLTTEDLQALGFWTNEEDDIRADVLIDFVDPDGKVFAGEYIEGRKNVPDSKYKYHSPLDYLSLTYLPPVPDDYMGILISFYKEKIEECRKMGAYTSLAPGLKRNMSTTAYKILKGEDILPPIVWGKSKNEAIIQKLQWKSKSPHHYLSYMSPSEKQEINLANGPYELDKNQDDVQWKTYYYSLTQRRIIDSITCMMQDAAFEYVKNNDLSKYYKLIPDTTKQGQYLNQYFFTGYYVKNGGGEGCESFWVTFLDDRMSISNITQVLTIWDTVESERNNLENNENALKAADAEVYSQYREKVGKFVLSNDPQKCRDEIVYRSNLLLKYFDFVRKKNSVKQQIFIFEHSIINKTEFPLLMDNYEKFKNSFDYTVHDITSDEDNRRMERYIQTTRQYDTIWRLQQQYISLDTSITPMIEDFKHLRKAYAAYSETFHLPNSIDGIKSLKDRVEVLQAIKMYFQTADIKALNKLVKKEDDLDKKIQLMTGKDN